MYAPHAKGILLLPRFPKSSCHRLVSETLLGQKYEITSTTFRATRSRVQGEKSGAENFVIRSCARFSQASFSTLRLQMARDDLLGKTNVYIINDLASLHDTYIYYCLLDHLCPSLESRLLSVPGSSTLRLLIAALHHHDSNVEFLHYISEPRESFLGRGICTSLWTNKQSVFEFDP